MDNKSLLTSEHAFVTSRLLEHALTHVLTLGKAVLAGVLFTQERVGVTNIYINDTATL